MKFTKNKLSRNAVRLLTKVIKTLKAEPKRFLMENYFLQFAENDDSMFSCDFNCLIDLPACRTVGCIAGWTVICGAKPGEFITKIINGTEIIDSKHYLAESRTRAIKLLGITNHQADALFLLKDYGYGEFHWPKRYEDNYFKADTPENRTKVAIQRIKHFIKHGR